MNREKLFRYFFIAAFLILAYETLHILSPFYTGIFIALVLTLMFFPLHRVILKIISPRRPNWAAFISSALCVILIVIPFILLSWLLFAELTKFSPTLKRFVDAFANWRNETAAEPYWITVIETKLTATLGLNDINLENYFLDAANNAVRKLVAFGKTIPAEALKLFINLMIMVFTLFFLFRDGQSIFKKLKKLIPMDDKHKDQIAAQFYTTVNAVVQGIFLVAVAQGVIAGIGFYFAKVPSPFILGFVTALMSAIPFVGAAGVWIPVTLYYFLQGFAGKGIFLLLWGLFATSLADNVIRIYFVGVKAKIPILFLFFGILGGAKIYGPKGFFIGPLIVALMIAFVRIYREVYAQETKINSDSENDTGSNDAISTDPDSP